MGSSWTNPDSWNRVEFVAEVRAWVLPSRRVRISNCYEAADLIDTSVHRRLQGGRDDELDRRRPRAVDQSSKHRLHLGKPFRNGYQSANPARSLEATTFGQ